MVSLTPRISGYPVMAPGYLDYVEDHEYEIEQISIQNQHKNNIGILHKIRGNNLVSQLISQKKANFATTIVSPTCAYRRVEIASGIPEQVNGCLQLEQHIEIATEEFSDPVMFQPAIITNEDVNQITLKSSHGVDALWVGMELNLPEAAIIAILPFLSAKNPTQSILRLRKATPDSGLQKGSFEVKDSTEGGFYFLVEVEESLYEALKNPESFEHRDSIYIMALAQGFEILKEHYHDRDKWQEFQHLKLLFQMLKKRSLYTWEDNDFKTNQAVAVFHPHKLIKVSQDQDGEDY